MPLTKWSFFWGGDIPDDPTFWGGNINGVDYDDPVVGPISRIAFSSIWQAEDAATTLSATLEDVTAGDTVGWAPGKSGMFEKAGDITCVSTLKIDQSPFQKVRIVRGDQEGSQVISTDSTDIIEQIHAEIFGHLNVTGGFPSPAAFVALVEDVGPGFEYIIWNFPITDLTAAPNKTTQWDNELSVPAQRCRMVSIENKGTVFVVPSDSSTPEFGEAFFLKPTFGGGKAIPATEIKIDLRPSEAWTVDLSRFHAIVTHNRVIVFYYAVFDADSGNIATAVMAYTPFHSTFDFDLTYNAEGVVHTPTIFANGLVPTISHKGAQRHGVSNDILIALQVTDITGVVEIPQVHWITSRGLGLVPDPVADIWDELTHPNMFGGRAAQACPDRTIDVVSVGWTGGRQEGTFQVVGGLTYHEPVVGSLDFINTYALDNAERHQVLRRMLIGVVQVVSEEQANVGGQHEVEMVRTAYMHNDETQRQGYDTDVDVFSAVSLIRLDDIGPGGNIETEIGLTAIGDTTLVPSVGMVDTSLFFSNFNSRVTIICDEICDGDSVVIALWVFPQLAGRQGPTDQYEIVVREGDPDDPVFKLFWDEGVTQAFKWQVNTTPGGTKVIDSTAMGSLKEDRWYYVTALYNADTLTMQLFLFGVLVAEDSTFPADAVLSHSMVDVEDLYLGRRLAATTNTAMLGRLDDFVMGVIPVTHQEVVASFFQSVVAKDGPVRTSRSQLPQLQDKIYATASIAQPGNPLTLITVAARTCNFHTDDPFRYHVVFDVWRLDRNFGSQPKYAGTLAPRATLMDRVSPGTQGHLSSPRTFEDSGPPRESDFQIILTEEFHDSFPTGKLNLYALFQGDPSGSGTDKNVVMKCSFNPDFPIEASRDENAYTWVVQYPSNRVLAWTVVARPKVSEDVYIAAVTTDAPLIEFRILEQSRFGGLGSENKADAKIVLPVANLTGSFFGYTYETAFNTVLGPTALPRGMVGRQISAGYGWPDDLVDAADVQIMFGLASNEGGTEISGTAPQEQIIGTCTLFIQEDAITGDYTVIPFPVYSESQAKQFDEYGVGGIDPIVPLAWLQNPHNRLGVAEHPGDTLVLGRTGNRDNDVPGREGQGGLLLYKTKREGTWGARPIIDVGPTWGASENVTVGASIAFSTRANISSPSFTPPVDNIVVCRPLFDRTDRYSTIYMSTAEASDGGWEVDAGQFAAPVLRRSDRSSALVWMGWSFGVRAWNERPTGVAIKKGSKRRAAVTLRWTLPGEAYAQDIPNP